MHLRGHARKLKNNLRSRGYLSWEPLVPLKSFRETCETAIQALKDGGHEFGDYLEFGVSRGTSMLGAYQTVTAAGLEGTRFVGFDSFEGMPKEAAEEGWDEGSFASTIDATRRYLKSNGANIEDIVLVKGWFTDTLTRETRDRLGLRKASIIMIDCDIYSASRDALDFCAPLIDDKAVVIFDDWAVRENVGEIGQKEAFAEFLEDNPELSSEPMDSYTFDDGFRNSRAFVLTRAGGPQAPG